MGVVVGIGVVALAAMGCSPVSPPIRTANNGAAGRLDAGELELGGDVQIPYLSGGPRVAYAPTRAIAIEAGTDFGLAWDTASFGSRFTFNGRASDRGHLGNGFALDTAVGIGLGGVASLHRDLTVGGGYLDVGGSYHGDWLSGYMRLSTQVTRATSSPITFWWGALFGAELWRGPFSLYVAAGPAGFATSQTSGALGVFEAGLSFHLRVGGAAGP